MRKQITVITLCAVVLALCAHAANLGKSQRELFRLQLDQECHQNRARGFSSADTGFTLSAGRISAFQHLTMRAESHEGYSRANSYPRGRLIVARDEHGRKDTKSMPDWLWVIALLAAYIVLMRWLLPRLGVPT